MLGTPECVHVLSQVMLGLPECVHVLSQVTLGLPECVHVLSQVTLGLPECVHVLSEQYDAKRIKVNFSVTTNQQELKLVETLWELQITQWTEGFSIMCVAL